MAKNAEQVPRNLGSPGKSAENVTFDTVLKEEAFLRRTELGSVVYGGALLQKEGVCRETGSSNSLTWGMARIVFHLVHQLPVGQW